MLVDRIRALARDRNAVILAHNYQIGSVQDIADYVGDSLELARAAARTEADTIVFCGVNFMAETAAILSPGRTVLLPAGDACCPMADMITAEELKSTRIRFPEAAVVCYVNTTADVKAESDICCTSANAIKVVESVDAEKVLFIPDKNLASYVARFTKKEILPWEGFCIVHDRFTGEEVISSKNLYPDAEVLVHPECRPEVVDLADHVLSTSGMIRRVCDSPAREFIIGTEVGILHRMRQDCPGKTCYPLSNEAVCVNMKKTTLEMVCLALSRMEPTVTVPDPVASRARAAIDRMLNL